MTHGDTPTRLASVATQGLIPRASLTLDPLATRPTDCSTNRAYPGLWVNNRTYLPLTGAEPTPYAYQEMVGKMVGKQVRACLYTPRTDYRRLAAHFLDAE